MLFRLFLVAALPSALLLQGCGANSSSDLNGNPGSPPLFQASQDDNASYYAGAADKSGEDLRLLLHDIIKGHKVYSYNEVFKILQDSDQDPDNPDNVILFYTGESRAKGQIGEGGSWNREHVWAKSHGFPSAGQHPYTDAHHLRACDIKLNSTRSDKYFATVKGGDVVSPEGNKIAGDFFEPADSFKGDVARMILYMDVRYEGGADSEPDLIASDDLSGREGKSDVAHFGKLSDLIRWNEQDPVDERERLRNEKVFNWQKNRNPFIDHPEWVGKIWGAKK